MDARRATKIGIGCTLAMLIPTIILGWWAIDRARGVAKWSEKADEFPTVAELRGDPIPGGENAALVYERAWEALELSEEQEELLSTSEDPEKLTPILEQNREALGLVHEAAQMETCRFEPVYEGGDAAPMPEFPHLKGLRSLLPLLRARVDIATASDPASALQTVEDQVRLSGHLLQHSHGIIEYRSAQSYLTQASRALERVLAAYDPTAQETEKLRSVLRELDPRAGLEAALQMEMAEGIAVIDWSEIHPKAEVRERGGRVSWKRGALWSGYVALNRSTYVREMSELIERCRRPWREIADHDEDLPRHNLTYLFTAILLPGHNVASSRDDMLALREMMLVALDIEAFIAKHGRPPESLDELNEVQGIDDPDYAFDVFSGERLRYRPGEGGYRLWSIGRDLDDDGGTSLSEARKAHRASSDSDLVFHVESAS